MNVFKAVIRDGEIFRVNADGTETVIGTAVHDELMFYDVEGMKHFVLGTQHELETPLSRMWRIGMQERHRLVVQPKQPDIKGLIEMLKTDIRDAPPTPVSPMKTEGLPQAKKGKPSTYKPCPNGPPRCGSKRRRQW